MRNAIIALLITIVAGAARAQSAPQPPAAPDYSPEHLRQIFTSDDQEPQPQRNFRIGLGVVEFHALGMDWRVGFLPFLAPLPGSVPGTTNVLPDAFSLNHVIFPGALPDIERSADERRELRRIARITANQ